MPPLAGHATLDLIPHGGLFLDHDARITLANAEAKRMLAAGDGRSDVAAAAAAAMARHTRARTSGVSSIGMVFMALTVD